MKKRTIAGLLTILIGVLVAVSPWLKAAYFEYSKNKVLNQWEQLYNSGGMIKAQETPDALSTQESDRTLPLTQLNTQLDLDEDTWEEDINAPFNASYVLENMEGIIEIDKINLRYPILRGATKYNLNFAICTVTGSPKMGEYGNYCLAGHKSRIYGRQFNRLMELQKGDTISLYNGVNGFNYVIVLTMKVEPDDTWVLDDVPGKKILTLITCDYTVKPTGRFIVKCEPIPN